MPSTVAEIHEGPDAKGIIMRGNHLIGRILKLAWYTKIKANVTRTAHV